MAQVALKQLNRDLNMRAPLVAPDPENFRDPKGVECWTGNLWGSPVKRTIIYLRSDVGCEFGVKTGGCLACKHFRLGTAGQKVDLPRMYVIQYERAVSLGETNPIMCIYNEGNMLNDRELPIDQLVEITEDLVKRNVKRLVLESRPEHITDETLSALRRAAGSMEIEIGIGLESVSEFVRNDLFLKAMSLKSYERSVARLTKYGMRSLAYVIVKPAFLNDAQAMVDAVETAQYAFKVGTNAISLEPQGVEPHTVAALMEKAGAFKPAWLWTVLDITRQVSHLGEVRIGGFQFKPLPETLPRNCIECTEGVLAAIDEFNLTYNVEVLKSLHCENCYGEYVRQMASLSAVIDEDRIRQEIERFATAALRDGRNDVSVDSSFTVLS